MFIYTEEQAVKDGELFHPYPERWPWLLITRNVDAACRKDPERPYEWCLVPLLMDAILAVKARKKPDFPIVLEGTVAGTVWIMPNGKGGLTVLTPSEY